MVEYLNSKPLFYDKIDYDRFANICHKIKDHIKHGYIIHIIGTNGKGTTGRFLATALLNSGHSVAHYTSPHIMDFNERIWINGCNIDDKTLLDTHNKLQSILSQEDSDSLSYFEYTTLLAIFASSECEYLVLEAGLGGERDATSTFESNLSIITPIGYDHQSFLGSTIEEIATTKLNAIKHSSIVAKQPYAEVYDIAFSKKNVFNYSDFLDKEDLINIDIISKNLNLATYLQDNLSTAIAALKFLNIAYENHYFNNSLLFGRLSKISSNVIVDVGHNPLAALSILQALKPAKLTLIYNTYEDKDYKEILSILKPIIKDVEIIKIDNKRALSLDALQATLNELNIKHSIFTTLQDNKNYLVFGSFSVVEEFIKRSNIVTKHTI